MVHWDGNIMKDSTNHEDPKSTADRLAISVTGVETEKILGIVKLTSATGAAQASAKFELLKVWEVSSEVIGMSFDTTASNRGLQMVLALYLNRNYSETYYTLHAGTTYMNSLLEECSLHYSVQVEVLT